MRINCSERMEREASRRKLRSSSQSSTKDHSYSNGSKHDEEKEVEQEEKVAGTPPSSPDGKKDVGALEERVEILECGLQALKSQYKDLKKSHKELQMKVENLRKEQEQDESGDDNDEFTVEKILQKRTNNGVTEYQIKWEGYEEMTWESQENLTGCREMVDEFEKQLKSGKGVEGTGKRKTSNAPRKIIKKKRTKKY